MLTIRFSRIGKKNKAQFRIVLQERAVIPRGRHIEVLGSWDPHLKRGSFQSEKIKEWIKKGAQVSDSVWNLLIKKGVLEGAKRAIKTKKLTKSEMEKEKIEATGKPGAEKLVTEKAAENQKSSLEPANPQSEVKSEKN